MTLIEIVMALTTISMIALIAMTVMSGAFITMMREKSITSSVVETQKDAELLIKTQRETNTGFIVYPNCFVPNHDVVLKQFKIENANDVVYTLVSRPQPITEVLPHITKVSSHFWYDGAKHETDFLYGYPTAKIKGEFEMDAALLNDFMVNTVYWYVSKPGFYVPSSIETSEYIQSRIPYFPSDYQLIAHTGEDPESDFLLADYAGRHIVMEVVPATLRGVIGTKAHAKSLYVHALTQTNAIYAHYDASCLDMRSTFFSAADQSVKQWNDISRNGRHGVVSSVLGSKILLEKHPADPGNFAGHDLKFQGQAKVYIPKPNSSTNATFFIVRKADSPDLDGKSTLYIGNAPVEPLKSYAYGKYTLYVYYVPGWSSEAYVTPSLKENGILNEVIVYSADLHNDADPDKLNKSGKEVQAYVKTKYAPAEALQIAQIQLVHDVELTVQGGTDFQAPGEANALLKDGRVVPVAVTWDAAELQNAKDRIKDGNDTDKPITLLVRGHVTSDSAKSVVMRITLSVNDTIVARLENRAITLDSTGKLFVEVITSASNKKAQITLSNNSIVKLSTNEIVAGKVQSVTITPQKVGKVDITISYENVSRKLRLVVTSTTPPMTNLSLWLDALDEGTVVLDRNGKIGKWKNKAVFDASTDFTSGTTSGPSYKSNDITAFVEFARGESLKSDKLYRDILFQKPYDQSNMTIYYVAKLNSKSLPHALFSQSHKDESLAMINLPSYLLAVDASNPPGTPKRDPRALQSVFNQVQQVEIDDDKDVDDDDSDNEDSDDKVDLDKKMVLVASVQHRMEQGGSVPVHFFEFDMGITQGDDEVESEDTTLRVENTDMLSGDFKGFHLGESQGGGTFDGKVYEVLIYKGIHDEATTEKVLKYLKQKWYD